MGKVTTVTLFDKNGNELEPTTFPSSRLATEATNICRKKLLKSLGWTNNQAPLPILASWVRTKKKQQLK